MWKSCESCAKNNFCFCSLFNFIGCEYEPLEKIDFDKLYRTGEDHLIELPRVPFHVFDF